MSAFRVFIGPFRIEYKYEYNNFIRTVFPSYPSRGDIFGGTTLAGKDLDSGFGGYPLIK
jgi:hypothetical protein